MGVCVRVCVCVIRMLDGAGKGGAPQRRYARRLSLSLACARALSLSLSLSVCVCMGCGAYVGG